jgi:hypothetical protein
LFYVEDGGEDERTEERTGGSEAGGSEAGGRERAEREDGKWVDCSLCFSNAITMSLSFNMRKQNPLCQVFLIGIEQKRSAKTGLI